MASGKSNVRLVQNEEGKWCYPATQRSDGTWRKPIPVRETYIPPELQEKYICKGRREADAAAANLAIKQDEVIEEDTTDFRMDHGAKKDGKETPSTVKKSAMPRMDLYWNHLVPSAPEPQTPPASLATPNGNSVDGPRKADKRNSDNSWDSPSSSSAQDVSNVPVVDFQEKCLSWKNMEDVCDKLSDLRVSEKKAEKDKQAIEALDDEKALAALLDRERNADMEEFEKLVNADQLSPPDYVNCWNYLVTKWIHIEQMLGVASKADIAKMARSNKLMI